MQGTGSLVVAGCDDGLVRFWNLEAGSQYRPPLRVGTGGVMAVATGTIDGRTVLATTSGHVGPVRTWWLDSGEPVGAPLPGEEPVAVGRVDGHLVVVSANEDDRLHVWNPIAAHNVHVTEHHDGPLYVLRVVELGDRQGVISGDGRGQVIVSDLATGRLVTRMAGAHDECVWAIVLTEVEGRWVVVSGGDDGTVRRWDLATGAPFGAPLRGHHGPLHAPGRIYALAAIPSDDGPAVVSGGWDGELWMWDVARGERIGEPLDDGYGAVQALVVRTIGGRQVLVGGGIDEPVLRVWDVTAGRLERMVPSDAHVLALATLPPA